MARIIEATRFAREQCLLLQALEAPFLGKEFPLEIAACPPAEQLLTIKYTSA
jgi:hypothetical protein